MSCEPTYRIISKGGLGRGTKIINIKTREEMKGVAEIEISPIVRDDQITAKVTLNVVELDIEIKGENING